MRRFLSKLRRSAIHLSGGRILGIQRRLLNRRVVSSADYWEKRYSRGGDSGAGSYGESARVKAEYLNTFVESRSIASVIELGCGDGAQLALARYPRYVGLDISPSAVEKCRRRFAGTPGRAFHVYHPDRFESDLGDDRHELALSLDVAYHLLEDDAYEAHLRHLFAAASRYTIIYSTDEAVPEARSAAHVRHRAVSVDVSAMIDGWELESRDTGVPASRDEPAIEFLVFRRCK
jgi:SAM-dependent methyltransferase